MPQICLENQVKHAIVYNLAPSSSFLKHYKQSPCIKGDTLFSSLSLLNVNNLVGKDPFGKYIDNFIVYQTFKQCYDLLYKIGTI